MGIMLWYHGGDVGNGEISLLGQSEQKEEITKSKKKKKLVRIVKCQHLRRVFHLVMAGISGLNRPSPLSSPYCCYVSDL